MKRQSTTRTGRSGTGEEARPAPKVPVVPRQRRKVGAAGRGNSETRVTPEKRWQMIATAAYYRAARRDFAPGHELEDWIAAEAEIGQLLGGEGAEAKAS